MMNVCSLCGCQGESALHVFWLCKFTRSVICDACFGPLISRLRADNLFLLLRDAKDELGWERFEALVVLLWAIWGCRNQVKLKGEGLSWELPTWSAGFLEAFWRINS